MLLEYALNKDDKLVSVEDVKRGRSDIRCPYCQGELTAKKGKIKAHHFAHIDETCNLSQNNDTGLPVFQKFDLILSKEKLRSLKRLEANNFQGKFHETRRGLKQDSDYKFLVKKDLIEVIDESKCFQRIDYKLTDLGEIILKKLSLAEFSKIQEYLSQEKFREFEWLPRYYQKMLQQEIDFQKTDKYQNAIFARKNSSNLDIKRYQEKLRESIVNFQIYCLRYQAVVAKSLYFLKIESDNKVFYKIGTTSRDIEGRIREIKYDLSKVLNQKFSISLLGIWKHRGNLEYYFKYLYEEFNLSLGKLTEYFEFPHIESVLTELNSLEARKLQDFERELLEKPLDKFLLSRSIRQGMQKSKLDGNHIGRPSTSNESTERFLAKPKNQAVIAVLKKGLSLRQTASEAGVSVNTVRKVKAALEKSSSTIL